MGKRVVLLLVVLVVIIAIAMENVRADEVSMGSCTPTIYGNCLDVTCSILDNQSRIVNATKYDASRGIYVIDNSQPLTQKRTNYVINNSQMLENLQVVCEFPEFPTKYCPSRGIWSTSISVDRHFLKRDDSDRLTKETFDVRTSYTAFECADWVEPKLLLDSNDGNMIDLLTGNRTIKYRISDDERSFLMHDDNTGLSHCGFKILNPGETFDNTNMTKSYMYNSANGWTNISSCNSTEDELTLTTTIIPEFLRYDQKLVIYAQDTAGNYKYHIIENVTLYPSLPLNENNGFCLRPNQCLINPSTGNTSVHSFAHYLTGRTDEPACVDAGSTINDVYCDHTLGLIGKSERILDVAILAGISKNTDFLVYCNANTSRYGTFNTGNVVQPYSPCGHSTSSRDNANCTNPCMLIYNNHERAAVFASTNQIYTGTDSLVRVPRIIVGSLGQCNVLSKPYSHILCNVSVKGTLFRGILSADEGVLTIGQSSDLNLIRARLNLSVDQRTDLNSVSLMKNNISESVNSYISVYLEDFPSINYAHSMRGTYQVSAYRKDGNKEVLGIIVLHSNPLQRYIIAVAFKGYSYDALNNYVVGNLAPEPKLTNPRLYANGDTIVLIGHTDSRPQSSNYIEQFVNMINV
jgi:hypothetical protein